MGLVGGGMWRAGGRPGSQYGEVLPGGKPGQPVDAPQCQMVPIRIGGSGTYPAVGAFLHRLRVRFPDSGLRSFWFSISTRRSIHARRGSSVLVPAA